MAIHEHTLNVALAEVLQGTRRLWTSSGSIIQVEPTGALKGSSKRPDIVVSEPETSPVIVEVEISPGLTVEPDALSRLGEVLKATGQTVLSSIALRAPDSFSKLGGEVLREALRSSEFDLAIFTGRSAATAERWPAHGWIRGGVNELSAMVQWAGVPPAVIDVAANALSEGVNEVAGLLGGYSASHPGSIKKISDHLHQEPGEQTNRMVAAIIANALLFQEVLAGGPGGLAEVSTLDALAGAPGGLARAAVLHEWDRILAVNYWPIFDIAKRLLADLPSESCPQILDTLNATATQLLRNRVMRSHDLTGAVFQRLIADRKFLAAYYTTPAAAALLAGLLLEPDRPPVGGWGDAQTVADFRIADFACGTGTLLSTLYRRLGQMHEVEGGDSEALHPVAMALGVCGCDVLPAAAHLTASMLSGLHPRVTYSDSAIHTVAFGAQPSGGVALGALDLLDPQSQIGSFEITAKSMGGSGSKSRTIQEMFPPRAFDVVVMNPPFTRNTNHEGGNAEAANPAFAAFGTDKVTQGAMSKRLKTLGDGTCYHGNAGEASAFVALADRELKNGGKVGLILPLSALAGGSWGKVRKLFANEYEDICVGSISAPVARDSAFSADTDMAECLIVGRKKSSLEKAEGGGSSEALFFVLSRRPATQLEGAELAREIVRHRHNPHSRAIADGPFGGDPIGVGGEIVGHSLRGPTSGETPWRLNRVADLSLAQAAYQLQTHNRVWLPGMINPMPEGLPIAHLSKVADVGPVHRDIVENTAGKSGVPRGPFAVQQLGVGEVPSYPILWAHDARRETRLTVQPDKAGQIKKGKTTAAALEIKKKADYIWSYSSNVQFNTDFRFNSQPLSACYTEKNTLGGRAWPGIRLQDSNHSKTIVLWMNSTLGLLLHYLHANKTQNGRGSISTSLMGDLPVIDVSVIDSERFKLGDVLFDKLSAGYELMPAHCLAIDASRHAIDEAILCSVLGLPSELLAPGGPIDLLRAKLAREPAFNGGKTDGLAGI